ncbi:MAG: EAL domain-containing protein [Hylemonella sp.]|nr:EAL domain-containing protein [Hylemonella sp.]
MTASQALQPHRHPYQFSIGVGLLVLSIPLMLALSQHDLSQVLTGIWLPYWRVGADLVKVVVAMLIFITGYRAILSPRKGAVVWLGVAFLGVGVLGFLHLVTHGELHGDLTPAGEQLSLGFNLGARLLAAVALLMYAAMPAVPDVPRFRKRLAIGIVLAWVLIPGYLVLTYPVLLPTLLGEQGSPTAIFWVLQGAIPVLNLVTLVIFWQRRQALEQECLMALIFAAALSSVGGAFFGISFGVQESVPHAVAHVYQVASYLFLFHATFNEALRRPLEHLEMLYQRENATLTAAPDGVLWVDRQGQIVLANPAMQLLSGYAPRELLGQNVAIFLPPHLRERHAQSMLDYFHSPQSRPMGMMDLKLHRKDGGQQPVDISLGYWEVDGAPHAIAYIRNLTERKKLEESLRHQATHDELTGLPNRWLFQLQLRQALLLAERSEKRVTVLFVDLDHFKTVNDTFGHASGDALLVQASRRIQSVLRASDTLARMGGDEFAILLPEINLADEAVSVAIKVLSCLQEAFVLPDQQVYSGASIGLAYYPDDARDSDTLLRYADMAMYQAKQAGRGAYACYSQDMDRRTHEDMLLHARLKTAIGEQLLTLHFQPQVDLRDGRLEGAEALLRWHDPVLGQVRPDRFIPLAEANGLILPLSDWVLETACQQIAAWQRAGTPLRLSVNVSAHQLHQGQLADKVRATLLSTGAHAHWLELEITESVAMTQPRQALEQLNALVELGCTVSLDDFGTGYSSLAYLKTLPVSKIKIDQSFVRDITDDPNDDVIVQTIIGMARNLGLDVIAEGVETEAQRDRLSLYGCNTCQGYLFHRPMPLQAFEALLHEHFRVSEPLDNQEART